MKKLYYILSLALATGLFASCSNDINGTGDMIPNDTPELPGTNLTRAFPEDDGSKSLSGQPAEKLYNILIGSDNAFSARMGNYMPVSNFQYEEVKIFTDELVKDATSDARVYRLIYNYVRQNVKYADGYVSNEPYDVFLNKKAVCQGYANLLNVMLHTQGIPVINANGWLNSGAFMGHAWNYAYYSGAWRLSDPTNSLEYKAEELDKYQQMFIPVSADGNFLETELYSYNYDKEKLNLNAVNMAEDAFVVPFSVTLNNGAKYKIDCFSPTQDLPENVKEIYIGKNIISIGQDGIYGLKEHGPNVEEAHVDPENQVLKSYKGVVYDKYSTSPLYIPTAKLCVELIPAEVYGKETMTGHKNVLEVIFPAGTKKIEAWAVENCPNLLAAYIPVGTEVDEKAFTGCHTDFQIIWEDQTGIKDVIAD
jgi:hypothetical protein